MTRRAFVLPFVLLFVLLLGLGAACGDDGTPAIDGSTPDAARDSGGDPRDGAIDSGSSDGGGSDASTDGGGSDAATDSGGTDGGGSDASTDGGGSDAATDGGASADASADTGTSGRCRVNCDCDQGLMCVTGRCIAGVRPTYCCDTAGCPAGESCTDSSGTAGTCPAPATDCEMAGGMCVVQFTPCPRGTRADSTVSCGGARALRCCLPRRP